METAISSLDSPNITVVVKGLNFLLQRSNDGNGSDANNTTPLLENYPSLLIALSNLLDIINPLGKLLFPEVDAGNVKEDEHFKSLLPCRDDKAVQLDEWIPCLPSANSAEFLV